jgi:hypothetical protein
MNGASLAFLAALASGLAAILLGQRFDLPLVSVLGSIGAVLAFACCAPFVERWRVSREQFGDAAYFLGFLFTLLALGVTLWSIRGAVGGAPIDAQTVVPQFALALGTTVAGLVARMLISGFTPNQEQAVDHAEKALAEASFQLARQMDVLADRMATHVTTTDDVIRTIQARATEALDAHVQALQPIPARVEAAMEQAVQAATAAVERALRPLEASGARSAAALQASIEEVAEASASVMSAAAEPIARAAEDVAVQVRRVVATLATLEVPDSAVVVGQIRDDLSSLAATTATLRARSAELEPTLAGAGDAVRDASARFAEMSRGLQDARSSLVAVARDLEHAGQSFRTAAEGTRQAVPALGEAGGAVADAAAALRRELARVEGESGHQQASVAELQSARERLAADIRLSAATLEELARELRAAVTRLRGVH